MHHMLSQRAIFAMMPMALVLSTFLSKLRATESDPFASWHEGSYSSPSDSAQAHYEKHGTQVQATDLAHYIRKAEGFRDSLKGAITNPVDGETEGVVRYKKRGLYIDLAPDGRIISFGATARR